MRPDHYDFRRIGVTTDWTAPRDLEYFIDRFGESKDYFAQAIAQVQDSYRCLEDSVNRAMTYLGCYPNDRAVASLWGKLGILENRLAEGIPTSWYRDGSPKSYRLRLGYDLRICRFGLVEHERLMPAYSKGHEQTWLAPIASLADHLMAAAMSLEESMKCEHFDYLAKMGEASWLSPDL